MKKLSSLVCWISFEGFSIRNSPHDSRRQWGQTIFVLLLAMAGQGCSHLAGSKDKVQEFKAALTLYAGFDESPNADKANGDRTIYWAPNMKQPRNGVPGFPASGDIVLARGGGKFGNAIRFNKKTSEFVFFKAQKNFPYTTGNWNGTVSLWLNLDPEKDLEPGYCDPIQITPRSWDDASFFVEFTQDEKPRHFRLGAYADKDVWNPLKKDWNTMPLAEKPLVVVTRPPFQRGQWTHVVFTFENFNSGHADGVARLYLNGQLQGTLAPRRQTFTWDIEKTLIMLGLSYVGLIDELAVFDRALSTGEVQTLHQLTEAQVRVLKRN